MQRRYLLLLLPLLFSACMKGELPVPRQDRGDVVTAAVNMEFDYRYQVYYSLSENREVGRNLRAAWDLGFETGAQGYHVVLNGAKSMFAFPVGGERLAVIGSADTSAFADRLRWDASSGDLDSTVIGDWRTQQGIFIIDRGYDHTGRHLGVYKIQLHSVDNGGYDVEYGPLSGGSLRRIRVIKDSTYNLSFLNLDSSATSIIEPPRSTWDLAFTQYTHTFHEPSYQPYLVSGCLLNRYNTRAAVMDTASKFSSAAAADVREDLLLTALNTIGYDWKMFTGSTYVTNTKKAFFIADQHGFRYKLHFVDFINAAGIKGSPKFEYQAL